VTSSLGVLGARRLAAPARDSVLVLGPTGGGKTSSILIPAILAWEGPVLAVSVKDDLVTTTSAWRRTQGPLAVIDPSGRHDGMAARFDPVTGAVDPSAARRVAASLCLGVAVSGHEAEARFWSQLAAKLLAPLLLAAHVGGVGIDQVAGWIDRRDEMVPIDLLHAAGEQRAVDALLASTQRDERQLSSVYATLEALLEPMLEQSPNPLAAPLAARRFLEEDGTLYLCAPVREQRRFAPLFCAVIDEVLDHAVQRARRDGGVLDRRLLVVLDEAAAIAPIADLDVLAATCGGQGISLVTCFQDRPGPGAVGRADRHGAQQPPNPGAGGGARGSGVGGCPGRDGRHRRRSPWPRGRWRPTSDRRASRDPRAALPLGAGRERLDAGGEAAPRAVVVPAGGRRPGTSPGGLGTGIAVGDR